MSMCLNCPNLLVGGASDHTTKSSHDYGAFSYIKKSFVELVAQDSPVHQRWFVRRRGHWSLASNQRQDGHCIVTFVVNAITKHRFFIAAVNEVRSYSFAVILRISMRQERINDTDTLASYKPPNYKMTIRKYLFALLSFYFGQSRTLTKLLPSQW